MSAAIGMLLLLSPLFPLAFGSWRDPSKPTSEHTLSALAFALTIWLSGVGASMLWGAAR